MINLLRKELSELMNRQMLISLIVSFVMIMMIGTLMTNIITGEMEESGTLHIIDQDQTEFTQSIADYLREKGFTIEFGDDFETMADTAGWKSAVVLPAGMTESFEHHEAVQLPVYSSLTTTSMVKISMSNDLTASAVETAIHSLLSDKYLGEDLAFLDHPVQELPYTRANNTIVQADKISIATAVATFDQFMPLVLFLLVVLTAQTIIAAICSEKLDKTLEALLSSPVPRSKIIGAKMLAALIVAVIYACVYGLGFAASIMFKGEGMAEQMNVETTFKNLLEAREAVKALGLQIPNYAWTGVIAQLCLTLGIALTAAIILGALTEDAKNAQSSSLPILMCTMFPYILSMVSDIRSMEGVTKWLIMAIPFTHTFIATSCLRFHDYTLFWGGMAYQALFLAVMIWLALKVYSSDFLFVHFHKHRNKDILTAKDE